MAIMTARIVVQKVYADKDPHGAMSIFVPWADSPRTWIRMRSHWQTAHERKEQINWP
jgi:hypothetical protein